MDTTLPMSNKSESDGSSSDYSQELAPPPNRTFLSSAKKNLFSNYRDPLFGDHFNDSLDDSVASANNISLNESIHDTLGFKERNLKLADVDKGLEVVGRCLAKAQNVGWKEFWSFLGEFVDIASADGLNKLENYLQQKSDEKTKPPQSLPLSLHNERFSTATVESSPLSSICWNFNKFHLSRDLNPIDNPQVQQPSQIAPSSPSAFHAYLCVEKSCQVFAKRLMKPITLQSNNLVVVNDAITTELGRLKSLVCSYKEDPRFFAIDFRAAHSRFAHILVALLKELADVNDNDHDCIDDVEHCLRQILLSKEKMLASNSHNNNAPSETTITVQQLTCLIKFILKRVGAKDDVISPETLTTERDCFDVWSAEDKCDCEWINQNVNHKSSRNIKRRLDISQKMSGLTLNAAMEQDDDELYWVCFASGGKLNFLSNYHISFVISLLTNLTTMTMTTKSTLRRPVRQRLHFSKSVKPSTITTITFSGESPHGSQSNPFDCNQLIVIIQSVYSEEPTKMDNDVFKALHNVEINNKTHPNIHQWFATLQNYSLEEREKYVELRF